MVKRLFKIDAEGLPDLPWMMLVTVAARKDLGESATIQEHDGGRHRQPKSYQEIISG